MSPTDQNSFLIVSGTPNKVSMSTPAKYMLNNAIIGTTMS